MNNVIPSTLKQIYFAEIIILFLLSLYLPCPCYCYYDYIRILYLLHDAHKFTLFSLNSLCIERACVRACVCMFHLYSLFSSLKLLWPSETQALSSSQLYPPISHKTKRKHVLYSLFSSQTMAVFCCQFSFRLTSLLLRSLLLICFVDIYIHTLY